LRSRFAWLAWLCSILGFTFAWLCLSLISGDNLEILFVTFIASYSPCVLDSLDETNYLRSRPRNFFIPVFIPVIYRLFLSLTGVSLFLVHHHQSPTHQEKLYKPNAPLLFLSPTQSNFTPCHLNCPFNSSLPPLQFIMVATKRSAPASAAKAPGDSAPPPAKKVSSHPATVTTATNTTTAASDGPAPQPPTSETTLPSLSQPIPASQPSAPPAFTSSDVAINNISVSSSNQIQRFFKDDVLSKIQLSKVRNGRFKVSFDGESSAVTTAILIEHDFHIKKEVLPLP
jgi:hypothetical protein